MSRLTDSFEQVRADGRKAFVGYLTAGDPNEAASEANIRAALDNGVDVLELGIPFSDPTADGPTIQAAAYRALEAGMSIPKALGMVKRLRADYDTPIILFGYANPLFHYGYEAICRDAAEAGADAFLVVDIPAEEAGEIRVPLAEAGLDFVPLIAPTTPEHRAKQILDGAGGFVYYIMVTGVTGARESVAEDLTENVEALRRCTDLPICVGFGVSNGETAREAAKEADGVVVGSALVKAASEGRVGELVAEIRAALDA